MKSNSHLSCRRLISLQICVLINVIKLLKLRFAQLCDDILELKLRIHHKKKV